MFRKPIELIMTCLLFCIILAGCGLKEEIPATRVVVDGMVTEMAVPTPTPNTRATISATRQANPSPTIPATLIPTIFPTATPIPLPLAPMQPFPTVTPDYPFHETKPIFLFYGVVGGDGGIPFGRNTPSLVIYGDGQLLMEVGDWQSRTVMESHLSPGEMCALRDRIAATGFLDPLNYQDYALSRGDHGPAPDEIIQMEDTFYYFLSADIPFLADALANGYFIINTFQPEQPLTPYTPEYLLMWIEEWMPDEETIEPAIWPAELPRLTELRSASHENIIVIEGDLLTLIWNEFSGQHSALYFQEGDILHRVLVRPLLPHETLQNVLVSPQRPRDYVPVLNCEGEPSLISPTIPTATPTLTAASIQLSGQGRILFVSNTDGDDEIYVMDADGTNRYRLTNNLAKDWSPVWFPDGQHVAFTSDRDGDSEIYVMAADGAEVIQVTNNDVADYAPAVSPGGEQIAFVSDQGGNWWQSEIYVVRYDGSQLRRLTADTDRDLNPKWSPNGENILFSQEVEFYKRYDVVTLNVENLETLEVSQAFGYEETLNPGQVWSPTGSRYVWVESVDKGSSAVQIFGADGTLQQRIIFPSPYFLFPSLDWSSDERFVIFSTQEYGDYPDTGIYVLVVDSGDIIQITENQQDEFDARWWP